MSGSTPAWDDDEGLIAWIEANRHWLKSPEIEARDAEIYAQIDEANAADKAPPAPLRLRPSEKAALAQALTGREKERLASLVVVLRQGNASAGMQSALADIIENGGLHGAGAATRKPKEQTPSLAYDLKLESEEYRAGLRTLYPDWPVGKYSKRAHDLIARRYGCTASEIEDRLRRPGSYQESKLSYLLRRIQEAVTVE